MLTRSLPVRLIPPLAGYKLLLGLIAFAVTWKEAGGGDPRFPFPLFGLLQAAFGATAALLLLGGREDRRALALGGFFLVTATSWSNGPLDQFIALYPDAWLFALADAVETHAFLAFYLWIFVRDFPAPPSLAWRRRLQLVARLSAILGGVFFGLSLLLHLAQQARGEAWAAALDVKAAESWNETFYHAVLTLTILAFPALYWKVRAGQKKEEQAQVRRFLRNLFLAFALVLPALALEIFVGPFRRLMETDDRFCGMVVIITLLPTLTLPFTVPHAVLVHRVMHVRLAARQALRYTLARWSALTLVTVPLATLIVYLYTHQEYQLNQLFSGVRSLLLIATVAVGVAALRYRRMLLDAIDRRYFREQYDARQILTLLVERIRSIRDSATLADLVSREIDLALHLEKAALLALDPRSGTLADPRGRTRKLDASSPLALTLSNASDPLAIDLENPQSPLLRLPEKDRQWMAESGFRLLVPILARDGSLLGLIGLGPRRSGLPFLREDRQLLHAIASSAAWVVELELEAKALSGVGDDVPDLDDTTPLAGPIAAGHAKECPLCHTVHPSYTVLCSADSRRLDRSRVPYVLHGKFRFEKRIGVGGMGVVYAGSDLSLGRKVAIKTLRQMSPEDAMRLRREAKTAAAVGHRHLAAVFGFETWKGMPMLVMELLEGGTLADRIAGKLSPRETVDLGIRMADALAHLHLAQILHRDIKPSNIGYTRDGVPKLMDFGIAGVIFELRQEEAEMDAMKDREESDDPPLIPNVAVWETGSGSDVRHRFAGTLSYLSPEAVRGHPADASFDLWSLSIVLYECLLGRKIFTGAPGQIVERIRAGRVPDFSQICPEHGEALADLFLDALHPVLSRRPATAEELKERLEEVREELA
ncbi:MAG TPA: serine/threonine-protein kinase [Thermoanaerobaculia bacterium]